jgi:hypothetical protein
MFWMPFVPAYSIGGYYGGVHGDCLFPPSTNVAVVGCLKNERWRQRIGLSTERRIHHGLRVAESGVCPWCCTDTGKYGSRMRLDERGHGERHSLWQTVLGTRLNDDSLPHAMAGGIMTDWGDEYFDDTDRHYREG